MYKETKPMLAPSELIDHLEEKGVKFELISKNDAQKYLEENNNYFKLVSYRKNFPKYDEGKNYGRYINLDFQMLIDLSIIDMKIRKTMLSIILDVEHYAKVKLLSKIEKSSKDGYTIIEKYIKDLKNRNEYEYLEKELLKNKMGIYCGDLVTKSEELKDNKMKNESYILMNVRELRNACAHNNCIMNDLRSSTSKYPVNYRIIDEIAKIGISKKIRDNKLSYYYDTNELVQTNLKFLNNIINKWYTNNI